MCAKCRSQIDTFFHMTNHYRKLRNVKAIVDSSAPKTFSNNKMGTSRPKAGKSFKRLGSSASLPSKTEGHVKTPRTKSVQIPLIRNDNSDIDNNLTVTNKGTYPKIFSTTTQIETTPSQYETDIISSPPSVNTIPNYEYIHFLLGIMEDILRTPVNFEEVDRIIKSHIEANRTRLDEERMLQITEDLKKKISSKTFDTKPPINGTYEIKRSDSMHRLISSPSSATLSNCRVTPLKNIEEIKAIPNKNQLSNESSDKSFFHKVTDLSYPSNYKKLVLKLQLDDNDNDDDYVIVDGPLYLPKNVLEKKGIPILLETPPNTQNTAINSAVNPQNDDLYNPLLTRKLLQDDYDLTPEKETQSSNTLKDFSNNNHQNDQDFQRIYKLLYQDATTNVPSQSVIPVNVNQPKSANLDQYLIDAGSPSESSVGNTEITTETTNKDSEISFELEVDPDDEADVGTWSHFY